MHQKKVHFYNSKKERLCGMLFSPSQRGKFPAIVICHGFTSSKYTKMELAKRISRKGFAVFIFDASGCGESEGNFEDHTITKYVSELKNAVDFLKKQKFVDRKRIGISGHSLGGMVAVIYAAKYRDAKAIIPVDAPYHMLKDKGKESHFADKGFLGRWKKKGYAILDVK